MESVPKKTLFTENKATALRRDSTFSVSRFRYVSTCSNARSALAPLIGDDRACSAVSLMLLVDNFEEGWYPRFILRPPSDP